jgi:hypothetical protein
VKRLLLVTALTLPVCAWAQAAKDAKAPDKTEKSERKEGKPAEVNWEGQTIKATGAGAPDMKASSPAQARLGAERAAQMDAFRNLLQQVKGIQISAGKTVGDEMAKDEIRGKVEGLIRGFKIVDKRYFSDGGVEIDVVLPLSALTEVVDTSDETKVALNEEGKAKNTGLVIDARGLAVTPALAPRLLDEAGKTLYAMEALSESARKGKGVAAYARSIDEAKKSERVGAKPLVIKASRVNGSDLILTSEEGQKLGASNNSFLAEGRVVIVTTP